MEAGKEKSEHYENFGWFDLAARYRKEVGEEKEAQRLFYKAIKDYEQRGKLGSAALCAYESGEIEKTTELCNKIGISIEDLKKEISWEELNTFYSLAKDFEEKGNIKKAVEFYKIAKMFDYVIELQNN